MNNFKAFSYTSQDNLCRDDKNRAQTKFVEHKKTYLKFFHVKISEVCHNSIVTRL